MIEPAIACLYILRRRVTLILYG